MSNEKNKSFKELLTKKPVIFSIIGIAAIVIIICAITIFTLNKNKNNDDSSVAQTTQEPTQTPMREVIPPPIATSATTSSAAAETESPDVQTPDPTALATQTPKQSSEPSRQQIEQVIGASNDEAGLKALEKKQQTEENQEKFDSYIENNDYNAAYDLLENFFKDNSYANNSLATFNNYVTYYEKQGLYNEAIAFELDYIEQKDGVINVREESQHYQSLANSLSHVPDYQDSRLAAINESVATWKAMTEAINRQDYTTVINTTKDYIKNGKDCVTSYLYLSDAYSYTKDYFEQAKVYYCYLGSVDENMNQLESSYYSLFLNSLNMMYYNSIITDEQLTYIENDFDYKNYLK